jgi:hypothetical protein
MCSTYFAHDAEKIMNTFVIAPRHLLRPLEAWRNRHKIRLWLRISYALIQRLSLQERFKVLYCGASFHPFSSNISLALWLYGEQFRSQDLQFLLELLHLGDTFIDIVATVYIWQQDRYAFTGQAFYQDASHHLCMTRLFESGLRMTTC